MAHAKLGPSSSSRWMNCPGSVRISEGIKEKSSPYAEEGTKAHMLSELMFEDLDPEEWEGYDEEMTNEVRKYVDYVMAHMTNPNCVLYTEVKVDLRKYILNGFGTADNVILDYDNKTLHVFDLKYGKGVKVWATKNSQGRIYAIGALLEFDRDKEIKNVVIHIGQPRLNHFHTEELTTKELKAYAEIVKKAAKATEDPNAPAIPGELQCRWCKASSECKALRNFTNKIVGDEFEDLDADLLNMEELSEILSHKKLIGKFLDDVEERVTEFLVKGKDVPGFQTGYSKTNRKWDDDAEEFLTKELGKDAWQKILITLGKAEKLLGKEIVADHTVKPQGKIIAIKMK
tara:strand:- start:1193 stop:2224 length:1032 start_codon:yes stop_codon:yes gene_type:complete